MYRTDYDCGGFQNRYPVAAGSMSWDSTNSFVASPNGGGQVTCWSPGTAWILAGAWVVVEYEETSECESGPCEEVCATDEFFTDSAALYGVSAPPPPPPPTSVSVSVSPSAVSPQGQTTVTVTIQPTAAGRTVDLSVAESQFSGGHQHSNRPLGTFGASSGTTNANGQFQTTYTASSFGGAEIVTGTVQGVNSTATLNVAVQGLVTLGTGTNYNLVGQTTPHPANHYGTPTANTNLVAIANQYAAAFPGSSPLNYDDQSLIQGGLFDVGPTAQNPQWQLWMSPHIEHRFGRNCDVPNSNVPQANRATLEQIFANNGSPNFLDEGNHWHLRF